MGGPRAGARRANDGLPALRRQRLAATSCRERNGGWWVYVDHKGRRKAKRCASKKAAQIAADKIDAALRLGQVGVLDDDKPARVVTFKEYAERWLETVGPVRLRPATIEQYQVQLRLRLFPALGALPMTSITPQC